LKFAAHGKGVQALLTFAHHFRQEINLASQKARSERGTLTRDPYPNSLTFFLVLLLAHSNGQVFYTLPILEVGQQAGVADYRREYSKYNLATTP
jgi:hypothetical protein